MSNTYAQVIAFCKTYGTLTLKLQKEMPILYAFALLCVEIEELKGGFKIKKINKPCNKYTKITFEAIESEEDFRERWKLIRIKLPKLLEKLDKPINKKNPNEG